MHLIMYSAQPRSPGGSAWCVRLSAPGQAVPSWAQHGGQSQPTEIESLRGRPAAGPSPLPASALLRRAGRSPLLLFHRCLLSLQHLLLVQLRPAAQ
ncbi:hypothetical protein KIL84_002298 [Mauremys mutica]|uniref:Uncharacterized protein n=1 Tax=Mauremys mutica TaxID=74926 RepID=A0A9D3X5D0_9SAUR|nr:hypothetical protein KIL84_002298 [Mauremys mutica]